MWRRSRRTDRLAGFSLTELLVTLAGLTMILTVSAQLMFEIRRAAVRQQFQVEARQLARAAVDYVHFMVRGASDLNYSGNNPFPAALLTQVRVRPNQTRQVSYNNVGDANLADLGTDIVTLARAEEPLTAGPLAWADFDSSATNTDWQFNWACPDAVANQEAFERLIGFNGTTSRWLLVADETGGWRFYQINQVGNSQCPGLTGQINARSANPNQAGYLEPMDGTLAPLGNGPRLRLGVGWMTLRVRGGWLEQKNEIFDPGTDAPGTAFVQLLPNVEDLQVAYLFRDGQLWNNAAGNTLGGIGVPTQGNIGNATDAANVLGLRITVTVRAPEAAPGETQDRFQPLPAEDHVPTAGPDRFYRYQTSSMVLMRNRNRTS